MDTLIQKQYKLTNDRNEPNKIDHRCPLKQGNTQSNYLAHNTDILKITSKQIYEYQGFN